MTTVIAAFITAIGGMLLAGLTYWFTKQKERQAELRKEKLEHYRAFTISLSGVIAGEATDEGQLAFARACNNLNLMASQEVLRKLQEFQQEIKIANPNPDRNRHDKVMSELFYLIRQDLNVSPKDNMETFAVGLWAAGVRPAKP